MTTETKTVSTSIQGAEDKLFTLEAGRMARLAAKPALHLAHFLFWLGTVIAQMTLSNQFGQVDSAAGRGGARATLRSPAGFFDHGPAGVPLAPPR